jgi:hypothetical protein
LYKWVSGGEDGKYNTRQYKNEFFFHFFLSRQELPSVIGGKLNKKSGLHFKDFNIAGKEIPDHFNKTLFFVTRGKTGL